MQDKLLSWFWEGGNVALPKRFFALMEPLGLSFDDLGKLCYLMSLEGQVDSEDRLAIDAAEHLYRKGLVNWSSETGRIGYDPLTDRILEATGFGPPRDETQAKPLAIAFADLIKRFESEQGRFLSIKEKSDLAKAIQKFAWSDELAYEIYSFYLKNYRRRAFEFPFFAQSAYSANVTDSESFQAFCANLERDSRKVKEVLRRLGKFNNPSEAQKEMYAKWHHTWGFSHSLILLACDDTVSADNPSFGYLDQILAQWRENHVATEEDVAKMRATRDVQRAKTRKVVRNSKDPVQKQLRNRLSTSATPRDFSHLEE